MTGTLFVVATPIGNLEDITLRALRTLREVSVIAAEDTRRTQQLLRHYDIKTPLISLHAHNERRRTSDVLERLRRGESVALVSDAGTPGISDPGAILVRAARDAGLRVDPIPGPSAVTAVLSAAGLSFDRFVFAGFPPIRSNDRNRWLQWVESFPDVPVVCFEAPHRFERTMADLRSNLAKRPIIWAREVTKLHEEWSFLSFDQFEEASHGPTSVPAESTSVPNAKGEFVLVLAPQVGTEVAEPTDEQIASLFGQLTESCRFVGRKAAIRAVAQQLQISSKAVFDALERVKNVSQT
jgi:16S rRNA (cytidine1402-2'-O)-methyltransferase